MFLQKSIVLYKSKDETVKLDVGIDGETVWIGGNKCTN
jgi:hypothetical protein